ncbi:MAG: hypothetical protein AB8B91_00955 [Rubripirellula sp.]
MNGYLQQSATRAFSLTRWRFLCATFATVVIQGAAFIPHASADAPLTRLRTETRQLLRNEAVAPDGVAKESAIAALCDMFVVMRSDERYPTSEMLQGDAAKIRHRLQSIARERKARLRREKVQRPEKLYAEIDAAVASALASESTVAQLLQPPGGNGGGAADNGWQLVELIQRIISPDFWDALGGPGTIRYFAMRRVLVVRATSDVHEQIKDLLIALR